MSEAPDGQVTISKDLLATYQRGMGLLQKLEGDPRSKPMLEDAVKVHFPDVTTEKETVERQVKPLLEPVTATLAKINERFEREDAERTAREERAAEAAIEGSFADLAKQGYTAEGLEKIKGLMVDKKIADPYAAAALFDKQNPPATLDGGGYTPQNWDLGAGHATGDSLKELFTNEDAWAEKQIGQVLTEIRAGK